MQEVTSLVIASPYVYTKEEADCLYRRLYQQLIDGGLDEEGAHYLAWKFTPSA